MSFKTILCVTGSQFDDTDPKIATSLCEEIDAHLTVLVVELAAPPPVGEYAAVISDDWLKERGADQRRLERRMKALSSALASAAVSVDVTGEYPEEVWADETIGRRARYADLVVVGPQMLADGTLKRKTIEGTLFSSGTPALLLPEGSRPSLKPKRILIAWDSSVEACNAVRGSLHMLQAATEVHVVMIDPEESIHGEEPGADLATYLARHGAKVIVRRLPSQGLSVAAVLKRSAVDTGADLIAMGAYGHSRLRQRIFGGVTMSMIDEPPIPILIAR